jgi:hypothetical protein
LMLFANGQHGVVNASVALVVKSARKLPFPAVSFGSISSSGNYRLIGKYLTGYGMIRAHPLQDLIRFAVDSSEDTVAIMFASGRVVSMEMATFSTVVASVLPIGPTLTSQGQAAAAATAGAEAGAEAGELPSREASTSRSCPGGNGGDEGRLRFLLEQIAQVSGRSADEQVQSLALDNHLEALHSALEVQRLVRIKGTAGLSGYLFLKRARPFGTLLTFSVAIQRLLCCVRGGLRYLLQHSCFARGLWRFRGSQYCHAYMLRSTGQALVGYPVA